MLEVRSCPAFARSYGPHARWRERDGSDGAFDGVVVALDAAIVDEARQASECDRA